MGISAIILDEHIRKMDEGERIILKRHDDIMIGITKEVYPTGIMDIYVEFLDDGWMISSTRIADATTLISGKTTYNLDGADLWIMDDGLNGNRVIIYCRDYDSMEVVEQ